MKLRTGIALCCVLVAVAGTAAAQSQSPGLLYSRAVTAYRALEYDSAAVLLQRALAVTGRDSLAGRARLDAYAYLGAAQQLRGEGTAAAAVFNRAIALDPRFRIDTLIFPPSVTKSFEDVRLASAYTVVRVPSDTVVTAGSSGIPIRIYTSAPHDLMVALVRSSGDVVRQLHSGNVSDSMDLRWDAMNQNGDRLLDGELYLQVRPLVRTANSAATRMHVRVTALPVDTLVHPKAPSAPRTGAPSSGSVNPFRALAAGAVAGAAAIFLPEIVSRDRDAMPERYAVGATLGAAGVVGFVIGRRNEQQRAVLGQHTARLSQWQREVDAIRSENQNRLRNRRVRIVVTPAPSVGGRS